MEGPRIKLYRKLCKIPLIKRWAFRIALWIYPITVEERERFDAWIREELEDEEAPGDKG